MLFNSYTFAIFFLIVYGLYCLFRTRYKFQNLLLLVASYVFYGWWDIRFLYLIVISTAVDYVCSIMIDKGRIAVKRLLKATLFFLGSLFICVIVKWDAIAICILRRSFFIDWDRLLSLSPKDPWVLWISLTGLVALWGFVLFARRLNESAIRRLFLALSIIINLTILGFFKYFNFFTENISLVSQHLFNYKPDFFDMNVILPVGISFFTFQTMSHTFDVYRRKMNSTFSLIELSTYVSFFPQLVAGPIERGAHLLPQFQRPRTINVSQLREGIWLIFWGLYKKIVIADNMAQIVNTVFGPYDKLEFSAISANGTYLLFAIYAFAIQIYCDFSGYSDIARGTARMMGFDIMLNFNLPYLSKSPSEFWQRWHISLSSWLRDYLYIPLGGNRKGFFRTLQNLMVTMLLGGLWHGAAWTFVYWGAFHGLILILYRLLKIRDEWLSQNTFRRVISTVFMFHLICFGWLLFRAQNMTTVFLFLKSIFGNFYVSTESVAMLKNILFYSWFLILFHGIQVYMKTLNPLKDMHWFFQLNIGLFILMSLLTLAPQKAQEFIYFAF